MNIRSIAFFLALTSAAAVYGCKPFVGQVAAQEATPAQAETVALRRIIADQNIKLSALEREIRDLTGRLEETEFARRRLEDEITTVRRQLSDLLIQQKTLSDLIARAMSGQGAAGPADAAEPTPVSVSEPADETPKPVAAVVQLPGGSAAEQFEYAYQFINTSDLKSARIALEQFLEKFPNDELTPNALFWLGRVHLIEKRPANAATNFLAVVERYQSHPKYAESLLDLADALLALDSAGDACNALGDYRALTNVANPRLKAKEQRLAEAAGC